MRLNSKKSVFVILVVIAAIAGCAGRTGPKPSAPMSSGGSMIAIEARGFKFSPNEIRVEKPGLLAIEIKNASGSAHNFTLKDPRGNVLKNRDINPAELSSSMSNCLTRESTNFTATSIFIRPWG